MNIQEEHKKEHLIAVEDVMRQVRLLAGWGQYQEYINDPVAVFESYHDLTIEELHQEQERLSCKANEYVQSIHPRVRNGENITRMLRDDEQDYED